MKKLWKSKTFWVNALTMAVSGVAYLSDLDFLPPEAVAVATGLVVPILNVILRYVTKDAIEPILGKKEKDCGCGGDCKGCK